MKNNKTQYGISYFFTIVLLYVFIFNPVFRWLDYGLNVPLLLVSFIYAVFNFPVFLKYIREYKKELWLIALMMLYLSVMLLFHSNSEVQGASRLIELVLTLLFIPIFLVNVVLSKHKNKGFLNIIIHVGLIAALITSFCLIFPSVQSFIRGIQTERELASLERLDELFIRGFGLGGNLTSSYGYMMGICGGICLLRLNTLRWYYIFYILLFVLGAAVNARTGIIAVVIASVLMLIKQVKHFSISYGIALFLILCLLIWGYRSMEVYLPNAYHFVSDFVDFFLSKDDYRTSSYVRMLHFPKTTLGLWFGDAKDVMGSGGYDSSDIGFVRDIYLGGLVFLSLLMLEQFIMYRKMMHRSGDVLFIIFLSLSVLVFYYKGFMPYISSAVTRFVTLYYFVLVYNKIHKNNIIKIY